MSQLFLDLGNTRLKYWLVKQNQTLKFGAEEHLKAPAELLQGLLGQFEQAGLSQVVVSSVLGETINTKINSRLEQLADLVVWAKVSQTHPHLTTNYNPQSLGVDRWLQLLGAASPDQKTTVVSVGTALTIDHIDQGVHTGGYIMPGLKLQAQSLFKGTRQIGMYQPSQVSLEPGADTGHCVERGIMLNLSSAIESALARFDSELVLTGGDAALLAQLLTPTGTSIKIEPELMLTGLKRFVG